jgi:hypothetical protein
MSSDLATTGQAPIAQRASFPRARVCINCRTLLGPKEQCDAGPKHRVASLGTKEGRAALLTEVWGPPSVRRRAKQLAKAGGGGLGLGSILEGCGGCDGCSSAAIDVEFLAVIAVVLVVAFAAVAVVWLALKIIEWVRGYMNRPKPNGGVARPPRIGRKTGPTGVVRGEARMLAPATGASCVAWALDLRSTRFLGTDLMLHDAETGGFEIVLDDGTTARISSGRVRLEGQSERRDRSDVGTVEAFVKTLAANDDPEDEGLDPFPFDAVDEVVVRPGDRVQLFGDFEREVDPDAPGGYRGANAVLVPKGVPALRIERR